MIEERQGSRTMQRLVMADVEGCLIARLHGCANSKPLCLCTRLDCWVHRSETCAMLACACLATLNHWMADAVLTS